MKKLLTCRAHGSDLCKCKKVATIFTTSLSGAKLKYYCYSHATIALDYILPVGTLIITIPEGIYRDDIPITISEIRKVYNCRRCVGRKGYIYYKNSDDITTDLFDNVYIEILGTRSRCLICGLFCVKNSKFCKKHSRLIGVISHRFQMLSQLQPKRYERLKSEFLIEEGHFLFNLVFNKE